MIQSFAVRAASGVMDLRKYQALLMGEQLYCLTLQHGGLAMLPLANGLVDALGVVHEDGHSLLLMTQLARC